MLLLARVPRLRSCSRITAGAYGSGVVAHDILGNSERMPKEAGRGTEISFWPKQNSVAGVDVIEDGLDNHSLSIFFSTAYRME